MIVVIDLNDSIVVIDLNDAIVVIDLSDAIVVSVEEDVFGGFNYGA
ncbi:hypothetical protein [Peribacillus loiseleuriae]|nr:hypothetical protein [Peribacillus loiseleuriae]